MLSNKSFSAASLVFRVGKRWKSKSVELNLQATSIQHAVTATQLRYTQKITQLLL